MGTIQKTISRRRLFTTAGASALTALAALKASAQQADRRRPNVLFLLTDDHRFDALGCMGNPIIRTPNIDALARGGVLFKNAFVTTSICCTSRASIFTGQYARRHGIHGFNTPFTPTQWARSYPMLLRNAGYRTGFVGKFGVGDNAQPPADDFDFWRGFTGQGQYFPKGHQPPVHLTDLMTSQAKEFLAAGAKGAAGDGRPFCLSISYKAPHAQDADPKQYLYAPRFAELYKDATIARPTTATEEAFARQPDFIRNSEARARWKKRFADDASFAEMVKSYYRLITGVDESVGEIVKALRDAGAAENTVIIVTGDNGYYFGEHGLADKWYPHEESIRVPLIVHDPRLPQDRRGVAVDEMALNIDLAPTMLALAGVEPPAGMQGRDLSPLVRGQRLENWRDEFFYEHLFTHKAIPRSEGVRARHWSYWKYLDVGGPDDEWLFDLRNDPGQTANLARTPRSPTDKAMLDEMRAKVGQYRERLK
jgi:arylsulfatase A-like enzyme